MKRPVILIILILLSYPINTYAEDMAGWDKTTWGMSKEKVMAIYKNRIKKVSPEGEYIYINDIEVAGLTFSVSMNFKNNELYGVALGTDGEISLAYVYDSVRRLLVQKYGQPNIEQDQSSGLTSTNRDISHRFEKTSRWFIGKTEIRLNAYKVAPGALSLMRPPYPISIHYSPLKNTEGL